MAINYTTLAATAERLIRENGREVTLRKRSQTPSNASKPWRGDDSSHTELTGVDCVVVPVNADDQDDELVRRDRATAYVGALDTGANLVEDFDELVDGSDVWKIADVTLYNPGSTRLLYELMLER